VIVRNGEGMYLLALLVNFMSWTWMIVAAVAAELMSNDLIYGQTI